MKRSFRLASLILAFILPLTPSLLPLGASAAATRPADPQRDLIAVARLSDEISIRSAGRGNPWINLSDGRSLLTNYVGAERPTLELKSNQARGLSLVSEDLNRDDAADLVCGYAAQDGSGIIALHRGNEGWTDRRMRGKFNSAPFLAPALVFQLPVAPEFLGAGDFDADGHRDVIAASSTDPALYLMKGDGRGGLGEAERVELPGRVTAMAVGEVNRADGLADVIVAVSGRRGPQVLVFEGPSGALRRNPEVIDLPSVATSLAIGQLDSSYEYDLAIAAGNELLIVHGRDRELLKRADAQMWVSGKRTGIIDGANEREVETRPPTISRQYFSFNIAAIALGDFAREVENRAEIAVLSEDGRLQYLQRGDAEIWRVVHELNVGDVAGGRALAKVRVSSLATDDLVVLDAAADQMRIVSGGPGSKQDLHEVTMLDMDGGAVATLPMRLSGHALSDLVILKAGGELAIAMIEPMATFTVTNTNDSGPGSLRQAILDANANPGLDTITFSIDSGSVAPASDHRPAPRIQLDRPLSELTDPIVLDGTTQAPFSTAVVELDGSNAGGGANGLTIIAGDSVVKGLAIGNFNGNAISLQQRGNNMIIYNLLGTDATCTENRGNRGEGVNILNSDDNLVKHNTIVFNMDGGSVINSNGNVIRSNKIGTDATMTQDKGNQGAGFGFANGFNNHFERNFVAFNQVGFFGFGGGGNMFGGDPLLGNIIGRNNTGLLLNNSNNNAFKGNFFGTDPRSGVLGNLSAAIELLNSSNNNFGGAMLNQGNTIAFNQRGINAFLGSNSNLYLLNSIHSNTMSGIDNNGGANRNVGPPQLLSATSSGSDTLITGRFFGFPNHQFLLQFQLNPEDEPLAQAKDPIGGITVTTNPGGSVDFNARAPFPVGPQKLTALATSLLTNDTSEISDPVNVASTSRPDLALEKTGPETAVCTDEITYTIKVRNVGTATAFARMVDELPTCIGDEVEVTTSRGFSLANDKVFGVVTRIGQMDPGDEATITIKVLLTKDCKGVISNRAQVFADGDKNPQNDFEFFSTRVDCPMINNFKVKGNKVIVRGEGFEPGDEVEINDMDPKKTVVKNSTKAVAKGGAALIKPCDPANPGQTNVINLRRPSPGGGPFAPVQDTQAFATCP